MRDETLKERPLSARPYAYQLGKAKDLAVDDLNRLLPCSLGDKEMAVATFLDLEEAFNNASTRSLFSSLENRGVPSTICRRIKASLKRTI